MGNPEMGWISHIDRERHLPPSEMGDLGKPAEGIVIDFIKSRFPRMQVRPATKEEDSGYGKIIDAVAYMDGRPIMGLQITTATDSVARNKKMEELKNKPFIRLPEMDPKLDSAIPRTITFLEAKEVAAYIRRPDFNSHPSLAKQILESNINSLKFDSLQTKNGEEILRLNRLIIMLEAELQRSNAEGRSKTN
jgi:hypothetical protein